MQGNDVSTSQIMSEAPYFTGTHAISPADLKTAAFDARFPYTNQSKNCWQNYVDFYRCQKKLVCHQHDSVDIQRGVLMHGLNAIPRLAQSIICRVVLSVYDHQ